MDSSKLLMAHITTEVIVIGGISFFFHKKISELNTKVSELEKKIETFEKLEKREGSSHSEDRFVTTEQFTHFQQQTTQHINNLYTVIRQITNNINSDNKQPSGQTIDRIKELQMKEAQLRDYHTQMKESQMKVKDIKTKNSVPYMETSFSLTPDNTNGQSKIEIVDDEEKEINEEELDNELEDELKDLSTTTCVNIDTDENSIKNEVTNTIQETPLEFIPTKGKKLVKKKKEEERRN